MWHVACVMWHGWLAFSNAAGAVYNTAGVAKPAATAAGADECLSLQAVDNVPH